MVASVAVENANNARLGPDHVTGCSEVKPCKIRKGSCLHPSNFVACSVTYNIEFHGLGTYPNSLTVDWVLFLTRFGLGEGLVARTAFARVLYVIAGMIMRELGGPS